MSLKSLGVAAGALLASTALVSAEELTIATVNNSDMIIMQELSSQWEEQSGHTLNWVVLEENVLRQRVTTDIATGGGSFDIITRRFANPTIKDTIPRIGQDGSNRQPKFILPSTRDRLASGQPIEGLALVSALWCRYCHGETESGQPIAVDDPEAERLKAAARQARERPEAFLALRDIFGDLADSTVFQTSFGAKLQSLWQQGVAKTLADYVDVARGTFDTRASL